MSNPTNTWADAWASSQQALMKAMFPVQPVGASNTMEPTGLLQEQFAELRDTWQQSIEKWARLAEQAPDAARMSPEALRELFTPARWSGRGTGTVDAALQHVLEGPKYATLFDLDRKLLELQQLAVRRDKDVAAYRALMHKAWNMAFERFSTGFLSKQEQTPATWRGMADRWLAVVNDTMIEVHRTDEFVQTQRRMLRSASDHRLQERKIAEAWCEAFHIPTRTEMDEMQRTVTELRRQLRASQRAGHASPAATDATAIRPKKRIRASKSRAPAAL
jgi:hypothetical protein